MHPPEPPIRVLLVDAQLITREGLRALLEADGFTVVGDTGDPVRAVELCASAVPDVAVVDPVLPGPAGPGVVAAIRDRSPQVRVLVLTDSVQEQLAREVLGGGASGYLLKSIDRRGLRSAVRAAADGRCSVDPSVAARLATPAPADRGGLTARERQVLSLVARGGSNRVVAQALGISSGTVRIYLSEIFAKLGAANRTEAATIALGRGLLEPAPEGSATGCAPGRQPSRRDGPARATGGPAAGT